MSVLYDLKVNRDMLDYNFGGYKLSLDPLAIHKVSLYKDVNSPKLPEDFYSYQHLKVFGVVNKLFLDPWNEDSLYFVDSSHAIHCAHLDPKMNCSLMKDRKIAELSRTSEKRPNVPVTMSFPNAEHAVVSDGASKLIIYRTDKRGDGSGNWKVCYEGEPLGPDVLFLIQHSSTNSSTTPPSIDIILTMVCKIESAKPSASHFITKLYWITFEANTLSSFELKRTRVLQTSGGPDYGVVEAGRVFVASEKAVTFVYDSEKPINDENGNEEDKEDELQSGDVVEQKEACYNWAQKGSEVTLYIRLHEHVTASDVTCDISTNHVRLSVKDEVLLDGDLCECVVVDASTWTLADHHLLEVHLEKVQGDNEWGEVIKGDGRDRRVLEEDQLALFNEELKPLEAKDQPLSNNVPFNLQQLEECDQLSSQSQALYCFHGNTHKLMQKVNISNHQWLFSNPSTFTNTPSICLRHDVDGLVFQLSNLQEQGDWDNSEKPDESTHLPFEWQHAGTLHAFGYLTASKQQKKFTACSTNYSFVAIAEHCRHVFIYRQPTPILTSLRNRKTAQTVSRLAKQHLVSLDGTQAVEGMVATTNRLFILTTESLYCVRVVND